MNQEALVRKAMALGTEFSTEDDLREVYNGTYLILHNVIVSPLTLPELAERVVQRLKAAEAGAGLESLPAGTVITGMFWDEEHWHGTLGVPYGQHHYTSFSAKAPSYEAMGREFKRLYDEWLQKQQTKETE